MTQSSDMNCSGERSESLTYAEYPSGEKRDITGVLPLQLIQKQNFEGPFSSQKRGFSDLIHGGSLLQDANSSCTTGKMIDSQEYACSSGSLLTLHPWLFRKDNIQVDTKWGRRLPIRHAYEINDNGSDVQPQVSPRNVSSEGRFALRKKFMRSRHASTYSKKPLDSVNNLLIPTLYEDDSEIEGFVLSPLPSQSLLMRPFYISDGSQIISKMNCDLDICLENGIHSDLDGSNSSKIMTGFTPLPERNKFKRKSKQSLQGDLGNSILQQPEKAITLPGARNGLLFFLMGCTVGIVLTMLTKRGEIEKLNAMLKQSENFVKDLEEELELKDSVTVKELVNESFENKGCVQTFSNSVHNQLSELHSTGQKHNENYSGKPEEKSVPLSTIEAELEAELERLELNINASSLEESTFLLDDLDDDLISHVVKGELREDKINGRGECRSDSGENSKQRSINHTPPANYSVSPKELCLRLYELNQCRLEERIKELEDTLYHGQNYLNVEKVKTPVCNSNSDISSSANQDSPLVREIAESFVSQPLCINLSGDALDAYNEAYDEFIRITQTGENTTFIGNADEQTLGYEFCDSDRNHPWGMESRNQVERLGEYEFCGTIDPSACGSYKVSEANEENDTIVDSDDEEGRILIQQIVERTKKGSPVMLDVQKLLLSVDK